MTMLSHAGGASVPVSAFVAMLLAVGAELFTGHSFAAEAGDGEWPMPARDYASTRFSPLAEITATNVSKLELAWSFSTGVEKGHEAAPIVVGDTMYVVTPFPNYVYAFDLS